MILDVTRHKFSEALLTLIFFAVVISMAAIFVFPEVSNVIGGAEAPLAPFINSFRSSHPTMSGLLLGLIYIYIVLRISRSTVRMGLYPAVTLAAIPISSVVLFGSLYSDGYTILALSALLVAEAYGRLLYCFSPSVRPHYLFSAMVALGALPLFDKSFVALVVILPIFVLIIRATLRETVLTILGLLIPTFIYCYVVWLLGGDFGDSFMVVWCDNLVSSHLSLAEYLTIPRLVYLGVVMFMQLLTSVLYFATPLSLGTGAREVWRVLQFAMVVLLVSLLVVPAASPALVVAMTLLSATMIPLLLQYASAINSVLAYLILILVTFAPLLA
jgi:hypothetical protein